jgi:hypothetical protein
MQQTLKTISSEFRLYAGYDSYIGREISCPHCNHAVSTTQGRTRHIMMKPSCRQKHLQSVASERRIRREQAYNVAGPSTRPHPASTQAGSSSPASNPPEARYNDPRRWTDDGRTCHEPFIERYPVSTAGAPISKEQTYERDLGMYLESCGTSQTLCPWRRRSC